tara:strand:+ start:1323 stop:1904 length:582 start_codon:yes stop_codon:yes gene_type:complete
MSNFLFSTDEESNEKVNIDELYDKSQRRDLKQVSVFNKILNRIHSRIKGTTRTQKKDTHIWFTVPEYIFGEPVYNQGDCIGYLVVKLEENGFHVKYMHPNTLFVSWGNWVPSYVRSEIRKKTGKVLDEKGNVIRDLNLEKDEEEDDMNSKLFNDKNNTLQKGQKEYTSVKDYKPTGNLVYNPELFERLEKKMN